MVSPIVYNLSTIPNLLDFVNSGQITNNNYYSINEYSTKANEKYSIIRYNK